MLSYRLVIGGGFVWISLRLLLVSAVDMTQEGLCEYRYNFNVTPVKRCPMNETQHEEAAARLGCNETQTYHCTPDKCHLSLIEFCLPKKQNLVQSGHCLELANVGILNQVNCQNFAFGCPETFYLSNELYKYPLCLSIAFSCFTSDTSCLHEKFNNRSAEGLGRDRKFDVTAMRSVENPEKDFESNGTTMCLVEKKKTPGWCFVFLALFIFVLIFMVVMLKLFLDWKKVALCRKNKEKQPMSDGDDSENKPLQEEGGGSRKEIPDALNEERNLELETRSELSFEVEEKILYTRAEENNLELESKSGSEETEYFDTDTTHDERTDKVEPFQQQSLVLDLEEMDCNHSVEDMELLLSLRRHCINGALESFTYMIETRQLNKENKRKPSILESRDRDGWSLLHYAAKGGSKDIIEALLKHCKDKKVDDKNYCGQTILHIACKYGRYDICSFLLSDDDYCKLLLTKTSHNLWNAAHFTAVCGDIQLFHLIHGKGEVDIKSETASGLNVLDIACIHNQENFCEELVKMNQKLRLPLEKSDIRGWTIAHFAAMVGNEHIFRLFIEKEFTLLKTHRKKTILHLCCEHGHSNLCDVILRVSPFIDKMLRDIDFVGWNALHFSAKGGNLQVFTSIEKALKATNSIDILCQLTHNGKTVLHICCIYKNVKICEYICKKLKSTPENVNKVTKKNFWTAAHYVAVGTHNIALEKELIRLLVEAGMNLKAPSNEGETVLTVACEHRNKDLVDYLLEHHPELVETEPTKLRDAASFDQATEAKIFYMQKHLSNAS